MTEEKEAVSMYATRGEAEVMRAAHIGAGARTDVRPDALGAFVLWSTMAGCEHFANGRTCDGPAVGGGGNGSLAYCEAHRPCACGYLLVARGEVASDASECDADQWHAHAGCVLVPHDGGDMLLNLPGRTEDDPVEMSTRCAEECDGCEGPEPAACPECERQHGPHYRGACEHGGAL